ncbi:unnamed protein product [Mytilus coruscus]|uniref:Integrase catalytic domain-containing protein n=1 Tax=Mytilus coruscus TaxID=42192 RepID=A0A6J8CQL8_MYTCO|nr:unnamed protein product [Mytilus coruscus]
MEYFYRKWENTTTNDENLQYVLPSADRNSVLLLLHNDKLAGHLGFKSTIARIRQRLYWAGYTHFVDRWSKRCTECQKRNQPSHHTRGQMKTYIVGEPLERISIGILGPVTRPYKGNTYVIVVTDYFTRYAAAYEVPDIEAQPVAEKLFEELICRYGLPLQIHTDQGSQFTSDLFIQLCKKLHIDKTRNSPFHPQSSGLVERLNRTIEDMISKFVAKHQKDWDQYLPYLMMAYRVRQHEKCHDKYTNLMTGRNSYVCEREEYTPAIRPLNIPTETTRQLIEFLGANMPDVSDLLDVEPRAPSPMRQLLNKEPPPEDVRSAFRKIPSSPITRKFTGYFFH